MLNLSAFDLIARLITLVVALTLHEYMHARVATWFGDDTPRLAGRLSLNPLSHLDPIGSLMLVLFGFGWAKPTPINPDVIRKNNPAGLLWVSLAGPFTNFALAVLASLIFRLLPVSVRFAASGPGYNFSQFLITFVLLNLVLWIFNLLPIPPLDGEHVLEFILPESWLRALAPIRLYGSLILLGLVFILPLAGIDVLGTLVSNPALSVAHFLLGI